jgi:hypothetical protein
MIMMVEMIIERLGVPVIAISPSVFDLQAREISICDEYECARHKRRLTICSLGNSILDPTTLLSV